MDTVMKDAGAALDNVEILGKVGIVGYCWGGRYRGWRRRAFRASPAPRATTAAASRTTPVKAECR